MPEPIIGFSEFISPVDNEDILYHVEWLTNEQSFPSLSSESSIKDIYSSNMDWQLLEEKEIYQAEHALPGIITDCLEEGAEFWEVIQYPPQKESYAKLATDAQEQLVGSELVYPFSPVHRHAGNLINKTNHTAIKKEDEDVDEFYRLYETHKSHGSHSHFGNKHYFERKQIIAYREFWDYWGCGRPEVKPRYLHQCVAIQSHAKQYKPPGPRNANKTKKDRGIKPKDRLEL